ncbi:hypothetical protein N7449_002397 [Penicillium cf. viridicatum]|uniref:F-box domain-containing protein n=1 Tax=Penicillium cf. viridicatum TaxID=2972119 RepID=A0A9W9MV29_9EURO|nr:hypothetical protein N7449_002397 [Penicillium cf. viridicatum]
MAAINRSMFDTSIATDRPDGVSLMLLPLNLIAQILEETGDVARLCRTCRVLNYMALPQLYRSLTLTSYDNIRYCSPQPEGISSASPFTTGLNMVISRPHATLVQSVTLRGEWREIELVEHALVGRVPLSMLLNIAVRAAIDRMTSLKSFSWELNTKMLETVYLGLAQLPRLTSLTIRFPSARHPQPAFILPEMPHLGYLKITDIDPICYPDDIATILLKSKKLRELKLHWSSCMRIAQEASVSLYRYFRKCITAKQPLSVKKLSFQNMYAFHVEEFNTAFDPATVEDVTVLSGTQNIGWVNPFVESSWPRQVFDRKSRIKSMRMDTVSERMSDFLGSFKGLERLYLVNVCSDSPDTLNSPRPRTVATHPMSPVPEHPAVSNETMAKSAAAMASPASQLNTILSVQNSYLKTIMMNHGTTLRHLLLCSKWTLSTSDVVRLVQSCPNLEQLALATDFSAMESLGLLVPFLRKLAALRLLIPPNSPAAQSDQSTSAQPLIASINRGAKQFKTAPENLIFAKASFKLQEGIDNAILNARSLASLVDVDDELLMHMMSYELADKQDFGKLKIVGMGWKAFELRQFYKAPIPRRSEFESQSCTSAIDPLAEASENPCPANGSNGNAGARSGSLERRAASQFKYPAAPSATMLTNPPRSTLGKRARDGDNETSYKSVSLASETWELSDYCYHDLGNYGHPLPC